MAQELMQLPIYFDEPPKTEKSTDKESKWLGRRHRRQWSLSSSSWGFKSFDDDSISTGDELEDAPVHTRCTMAMRRRSLSFSVPASAPISPGAKIAPTGAMIPRLRPEGPAKKNQVHAACVDSVNSLINITNQKEREVAALKAKMFQMEDECNREKKRALEAELQRRDLEDLVEYQRQELEGLTASKKSLETAVESVDYRAEGHWRDTPRFGERDDHRRWAHEVVAPGSSPFSRASNGFSRPSQSPLLRSPSMPVRKSWAGFENLDSGWGEGEVVEDEDIPCSESTLVPRQRLDAVEAVLAERTRELEQVKSAHRQAVGAWKESESQRMKLVDRVGIAEDKARRLAIDHARKTKELEKSDTQKEEAVAASLEARAENKWLLEELAAKETLVEDLSAELARHRENGMRMELERERTEGEIGTLRDRVGGMMNELKKQSELLERQAAELEEALDKADQAKAEKIEARSQVASLVGQRVELVRKVAALEERIARISAAGATAVSGSEEGPEGELAVQQETIASMGEEIGRLQLQLATREEALTRVAEKNREMSRTTAKLEQQKQGLEKDLEGQGDFVAKMVERLLKISKGEDAGDRSGVDEGTMVNAELAWHREMLMNVVKSLREQVSKLTEEKAAQRQQLGIVVQTKEEAMARLASEVSSLREAQESSVQMSEEALAKLALTSEQLEETKASRDRAVKARESVLAKLAEAMSCHSEHIQKLTDEKDGEVARLESEIFAFRKIARKGSCEGDGETDRRAFGSVGRRSLRESDAQLASEKEYGSTIPLQIRRDVRFDASSGVHVV